ncbi:fatty acid desaturase family protein [Bacteroidota bacterium]|nr:fatty acid desaturase family protein [Bacteroidota bacterium]
MTSTLNNAAEIRKIISNKKVRDLHIVSDLKGILSILLEWTLIITCTILSETYFSWYFYPIVVMFLGARYLALGLIMHESVHNLVSKNSFVNDWLSEIFCSWPMLISMRSYKIKHLAHHAWLNSDDDPDFISKADENWQYPMMKYKFLRILITQLSGLGIFETLKVMSSSKMKVKKPKTPLWYHLLRYSFYLTTIGLFLYFDKGLILVLYWLVPFFTWTQIANRLRRVAEHSAVEGKSHDLQTRTTKHGIIVRIFLSPKFISFHNEHHIYPGIPCYNLRKAHKVLNENELVRNSLHVSNSYLEVYKECILD